MLNVIEPQLKVITFPSGKTAKVLETLPTNSALDAITRLDIPKYRFAISIHAGMMQMSAAERQKFLIVLKNSLIRFAVDNNVRLADGATDTPVVQVLGDAYRATKANFPFLGITVSKNVSYPDGPESAPGRWPLNESHSYFVIVDADEFGVESHLLVGVTRAQGNPGIAIAINGGEIVRAEIEMHAALGTPVIAMRGTGRYADDLAMADPSSELRQPFTQNITPLEIFDLETQSPEDLYHMIRRMLLR